MNASTLGHVLLDATKKQSRNAGAFKRKIGSALKALTDSDVLREWMYEQVNASIKTISSNYFSLQVCDSVPQSNSAGREAEMEKYNVKA